MTSERAAEAGEGGTWRCPSCRDTVAPMGMCQKCGVFGLRYESRAATPAPREDGWEELRREIEALHDDPIRFGSPKDASQNTARAVLAIVDRLAVARGESPEPGPAIDVERLSVAMSTAYKSVGSWDDFDDAVLAFAEATVREYGGLGSAVMGVIFDLARDTLSRHDEVAASGWVTRDIPHESDVRAALRDKP